MAENNITPSSSNILPSMSTADLRDLLEQSLMDTIKDLLEGAQADVQRFVAAIASDIVAAAATGNTELVAELKLQIPMVAEANRIRMTRVQSDMLSKIFEVLTGFLLKQLAGVSIG